MGKETGIEWTDRTFNIWWGCEKVSEGCRNCYAETLDRRLHKDPHWGPGSSRKIFGEKYWKQLEEWNTEAKLSGTNSKAGTVTGRKVL